MLPFRTVLRQYSAEDEFFTTMGTTAHAASGMR